MDRGPWGRANFMGQSSRKMRGGAKLRPRWKYQCCGSLPWRVDSGCLVQALGLLPPPQIKELTWAPTHPSPPHDAAAQQLEEEPAERTGQKHSILFNPPRPGCLQPCSGWGGERGLLLYCHVWGHRVHGNGHEALLLQGRHHGDLQVRVHDMGLHLHGVQIHAIFLDPVVPHQPARQGPGQAGSTSTGLRRP